MVTERACAAFIVVAMLALAPCRVGAQAAGGSGSSAGQAPATDQATTNARTALQQYSEALQSLDAAAVKRVQPSVNVENLARAFRDMRELKVDIDAIRVLSADAQTLRVSCRVTQTLTPKAGARQTTAVTRVIRLRHDASGWVIDAFER